MRTRALALSLVAAAATMAQAQRTPDPTSFSFMFENDTFNGSDSAYTNGLRLGWGINRYRPGMRYFIHGNLPSLFDRVSAHRLSQNGIIPRTTPKNACPLDPDRAKLWNNRPCTILALSLAQIMYTPDTIAGTSVVTHSRPYAGLLYATGGVTTLSADKSGWLAFSEVSNLWLLGVSGPPSGAEDAQSFAHWAFSTGAHRPMGWDTQLKTFVHFGAINDIVLRPRGWEHCAAPTMPGVESCDGTVDEKRRSDASLHSELVTSTHMLRYSLGTILRAGMNYPDAVGGLRIPVNKGARGTSVISTFWWNVFADFEGRWVPYNYFIKGGFRDDDWRAVSELRQRPFVGEVAYGLSFGTREASGRIETTSRTPEYDVNGRRQPRVMHGYMTFMLSIHPSNPK